MGFLVGVAAARWTTHSSDAAEPTVRVQQGDLVPKIYASGELRASRFTTLAAPAIGGGALQITRLRRTGTPVKKGDIVIEFDPSEQQFKLEQSRSDVEQADQEIAKAKADAAVQTATDQVALLKAHFDVRRAELEVGKNELVSAIDGKKNELALTQARRALAQLEQDSQSHASSSQAGISVALEKRHKARLAMDQARDNIQKMQVRSPMDGIFAIDKNENQESRFSGTTPDYHEGDQVGPGSTIGRVIDPGEIEITAKLNERDRSSVEVGSACTIALDAMPGHTFEATLKTIGGLASRSFWDSGQGANFEATIQIPHTNLALRPGLTAQIVISGMTRKNVLSIPRQAVFSSENKRVVYVKTASGFEAREVKVLAETESRSAIEGLSAGDVISFVDPTTSRKLAGSSTAEPTLGPR